MKLFLDSYFLTCNSKCEKLLGAKLDRELTFYDHTSQLCENACRKISEGDTLYKYIKKIYSYEQFFYIAILPSHMDALQSY